MSSLIGKGESGKEGWLENGREWRGGREWDRVEGSGRDGGSRSGLRWDGRGWERVKRTGGQKEWEGS